MVIPCDDCVVAVLTADLNVGKPLGNDELFLVSNLLDEYDLLLFHKGAAYLDGFTDISKFACAVAGHKECVGIVVILSLHCDDTTECANDAD